MENNNCEPRNPENQPLQGPPPRKPPSIEQLETELQTYEAELELQNETLRETECRLEESHALYRQLFNLAPIAYFVLDSNHIIKVVNKAGAELLNEYPAKLTGLRFTRFVAPESQDIFHRRLIGLHQRSLRTSIDVVLKSQDGPPIHAEVMAARTGSEGENFLLSVRDITERRQFIAELQERQAEINRLIAATIKDKILLETVTESIGTHVAYLDRDFNFQMVNNAYVTGSGRSREELIGKNHFDLFPDEENEAIFRRVRDKGIAESYHDKPFEFPDQPGRGITYWDWSLTPVKSPSGETEGMVFALAETTQRVRAANILKLAAEQLEETVSERTSELYDLNQNLAGEVDRRTLAEAELRSLSRRLVEVQEEERRRISKELHDEVGQHLTVLKMILDTGLKREDAMSKNAINSAIDQVKQVITQVRNLSMELHPSMLNVLGLETALNALFERLKSTTGLTVELHSDVDDSRLNPDTRLCAYRVVQEALTNVLRYAGVKEARVTMADKGDSFTVTISDKGKGFDLADLGGGRSSGISGMRERVLTLGGSFQLETGPGCGTRIELELPYAGV
ncbi:PAS domain S-box protein [Dehalogenimonas sp. THU2]|uniref:PAS domain-containing sensor histidine kinase n=1 Tax=Dehalogenimonas sp. THU2 TaxID=3151121 RepID=UPI003218D060